ncbi:MAG: hypothetical protein AAF594_01340 [Bacteroidota bacterium]
MSRLLLLALAATLAACGPPASGLDPDDVLKAANTAIAAHDTDRALDLLAEAADQGHLGALGVLAEAYERGYLRAPDTNLPIWSCPGQATLASRRYQDALRAGAHRGEATALHRVAREMLARRWDGQTWQDPSAADRDSAEAIYRQLDGTQTPSLELSGLARALGRDAEAARILEAAAAHDVGACIIHTIKTVPRVMAGSAALSQQVASEASYLDAMASCDALARAQGDPLPGARRVTDLAESAASGDARAADLLDGLRAEGVFDRHPHLQEAARPAAAPARSEAG